MVQSAAKTVADYLNELPEDRRAVVSTVRDVIVKNLPKGYQESINFGMISYEIPLERYRTTYNKQPLCYVALAAQKNHYAVYLMCACSDSLAENTLREGFAKAGKKLDKGKSCVRFKKLEDVPLDVIGKAVASFTPDQWISIYEKSRAK
jgi:hypothetical protein